MITENRNQGELPFLREVSEKLQIRIQQIDQSLEEGQKEIENMNDYYWESYTEMDQYGYENYDNQQALLHQINTNQEKLSLKHRFRKMLDSPFFGRVDFLFDGEEQAETFYIGIGNFAEKAGMPPLIYDWRAPVCSLFYDYDQGPASYQAPAGTMEGEITSKWQYKIKEGKLVYAFESDTKIDDEILKEELGEHADTSLKNIVRTIQKEQNAIIRNTKDRIMVIQGVAGSGKTSVALHRIAYLLYHDREHLKSSNMLILSPNSVFSDYISHILPELGEENIQEMSFDLFAYWELKDVVYDCEDRYHQMERMMEHWDEQERERFQRKQSEDFLGQTEGFLAVLEDRLMDFRSVEFRGMKLSEQEMIQLFYFKFQDIPLLARMDAVMEYFADAYETLSNRDLSEEERLLLQEKFDKSYLTRDIYVIYQWLMEECGYPGLPDVPYEKRRLRYEDVFPMLYLKYRLVGNRAHQNIKHLVIDEMQDYSYLQYTILKELFSCPMTILGDRKQTMDGKEQDVCTFLPRILGKNIRKIVMNKSYRNTVEIAEYAKKIQGGGPSELLQRHGQPVTEQVFAEKDALLKAVAARWQEANEKFETAALITMTEREAQEAYRGLKEMGLEVSYIDRDSDKFQKGLNVTTFYMAKGLEFDQVFGVFPKEERPLSRQARYICATRALHQLFIYLKEE